MVVVAEMGISNSAGGEGNADDGGLGRPVERTFGPRAGEGMGDEIGWRRANRHRGRLGGWRATTRRVGVFIAGAKCRAPRKGELKCEGSEGKSHRPEVRPFSADRIFFGGDSPGRPTAGD